MSLGTAVESLHITHMALVPPFDIQQSRAIDASVPEGLHLRMPPLRWAASWPDAARLAVMPAAAAAHHLQLCSAPHGLGACLRTGSWHWEPAASPPADHAGPERGSLLIGFRLQQVSGDHQGEL